MADVPVAKIDATGLHLPTYDEGLAYFQAGFRRIYGDDVVLEASTQDGQFMALLALALKRANDSVESAYNAFSPAKAQGVGLASNVKINGLSRKTPSRSSVDLIIVGQAGATLVAGAVSDAQGQRWNLPTVVTIPPEGEVFVTATADKVGAILAPADTITAFATVQQGFQTVTNPDPAAPGLPVESDAQLRRRQAISTALPAHTILESLMAGVLALPGVTRARGYENDTNVPDAASGGLPGHALALVVEGGDGLAIASLLRSKKAPGVGTYGSESRRLIDAYGIPHDVGFFRPRYPRVAWYLTVRAFRGYTADIENKIRSALAVWTKALGIGNRLPLTRAYVPANLTGADADTFEILTMVATRDGLAPGRAGDLEAAFDEVFVCDALNDVTIRVVP